MDLNPHGVTSLQRRSGNRSMKSIGSTRRYGWGRNEYYGSMNELRKQQMVTSG
jgi:hypothetical protein